MIGTNDLPASPPITAQSNYRIPAPLPSESTVWIDKDHGIRANSEFIKSDSSVVDKAQEISAAVFNEVSFLADASKIRLKSWWNNNKYPQFEDSTPLGKANSRGLAILFHGINSHPSLWQNYTEELKKLGLDVFVPNVPNCGHCYTDSPECKTLLERIVTWTRENSGPIFLFGNSNGSRFAVRFETWLRERAPKTPVYVSLTAGVLYGSSRINQLTSIASPEKLNVVTRGSITPILCEELTLGNDHAKALLAEVRKPLGEGVASREYVMHASVHDTHVPDVGSSLPILNPTKQEAFVERHYLVNHCSHMAILAKVKDDQIADCARRLDQFKPAAAS